jgi:hypothetical protein
MVESLLTVQSRSGGSDPELKSSALRSLSICWANVTLIDVRVSQKYPPMKSIGFTRRGQNSVLWSNTDTRMFGSKGTVPE